MNCKPGDLAYYVGPHKNIRGMVLLIVRPDPDFPGAWIHEPHTKGAGKPDSVWDEHVRPIRDPGDEETDEMLQLLGKPNEVAV
jgi:hypothetical protein